MKFYAYEKRTEKSNNKYPSVIFRIPNSPK